MMDSDSDDDIIPNASKFSGIFAKGKARLQVQRHQSSTSNPSLKCCTPQLHLPEKSDASLSGSNKSKSKLKEMTSSCGGGRSSKVSIPVPDKKQKSKKRKVAISEDTKDLLAQLDHINSFPLLQAASRKQESNEVSSVVCDDDIQLLATVATPPYLSKYANKEKPKRQQRGRGRSRGRPRRKKPEEVVSVHDLLNISKISDSLLNDSQLIKGVDEDSETCEVSNGTDACRICIRWNFETLRFQFQKGTKISKLRMEIANQMNVRADDLVILDDLSEEIPDNILVEDIRFGRVLEAFIRDKDQELSERRKGVSSTAKTAKVIKIDPDSIQLKVQGGGSYRDRMNIVIKRTTHVKQIIEDYIEKFELHGKEFKLVFDGDTVDPEETPETLDLDGDEIFDIVEVT